MEFVTLLLSGHLIFIFVTAFSPDENLKTEFVTATDGTADDFNLYVNILPRYYDIELKLDIEKDVFHGTCHVNIDILNTTRYIHLHSANLNITNSTLINAHDELKHKLHNITYINKQEIVSLDFNLMLLPIYHYTLHIAFTGTISNTEGLFKTSYVNKEGQREWLIATHNSGNGTRHLFPCWDEPRFKANFKIILKYHYNYTAFSNMPSVGTRSEKDMTVTRFATTPVIPTYLIAITLMRLSESSISSTDFKLWGRWQITEHLTYAVSTTKRFTHAFENEWSYLKNFTEQYFVIPGWLDDGMDKWQMVFYREANVIYNEEIDPLARAIEISRLIARKVAGQYIGSAINSSQWSQLWLHSSISTLLGINTLNKIIPDFRMMDLFVVRTLQESLRLDNNTFVKSLTSEANNISEINSLSSFAYYLKGPVILRMFQHLLGNEVLQEGINVYLKMQSNSPDSFWTAMQAAYNNKIEVILAPEDLKEFNIRKAINSWINQSHYPILNIKLEEDVVIISIQNEPDSTWWIPVTYAVKTEIYFNNTLPKIWLKSSFSGVWYYEPISINRMKSTPNFNEDWIIFNLQQTGYYRVNYCTENWRIITNYLSSKDYTKVHVLNRAQIIDDAFYFMITNQLQPFIFWELTIFLSQETDYIVWYPMFKAIEYMSYSYPFHNSQEIKQSILNRMVALLHKIGYEEHSEEKLLTQCLREEAAKWACVSGDNKCKIEANAKLKRRLSHSEIDFSLPWRKWIYCHGLSIADDITIDKVFDMYFLEKSNVRVLEFLTCSDNYLYIISLLKKVMKLEPDSELFSTGVKDQKMIAIDYINMFHHIVQRHAKNDLALQYILSNWKEIKPKEITSIAALIDIINHIYSTNHLDKISEFMTNVEKETPKVVWSHMLFGADVSPINILRMNEVIKESYSESLIPKIQNKINIRLSQINRHTNSFVFM